MSKSKSKSKKTKFIMGYYNEYSYTILEFDLDNGETRELYWAGNSPYDSQMIVKPEYGLDLEEMRDHCEESAREIAAENGAEFLGVEYEEYEC